MKAYLLKEKHELFLQKNTHLVPVCAWGLQGPRCVLDYSLRSTLTKPCKLSLNLLFGPGRLAFVLFLL